MKPSSHEKASAWRPRRTPKMATNYSKTEQPDLLLLDIRMPGMSGDELLAKMRSTEWGADIRVIILTNLSRDEAPSSLRFLGVDRYVVKAHHTPSQVVDIVREVLALP